VAHVVTHCFKANHPITAEEQQLNTMDPIAKMLIGAGILLLIVGTLIQLGIFNYLKLGRLPGDIIIERESTKIYIPIVTCLVLSALMSLVSLLFRK
jgi:hypothetical protein